MSEVQAVVVTLPTRLTIRCYCGCGEPATDIIKEVDGIVAKFATRVCHIQYMADRQWR